MRDEDGKMIKNAHITGTLKVSLNDTFTSYLLIAY
jgi:hypothetical protein